MTSKRHFTGTVTKMHDNFGFIDDDVFFQLPCCEGRIPAVGDVVVVDAQFNPNMPFKWTASRVKLAPKYALQAQLQAFNVMQSSAQNRGLKFGRGGAGILGAAPSNVMGRVNQQRHMQMSGPKGNRQGGHQSSPQKRKRDNRNQKKRRTRTPPKPSPAQLQRNASTDKSNKSQRRPAPRYMVQYTKRPLTMRNSDVLNLKVLHANMYIPSDFYCVNFNWQDTFGVKQPRNPRKCQFHVLQKDVEALEKMDDAFLNPPDADHTWVAKVMLLQAPSKDETYRQCCHLAEDTSEHFLHQSRVYKFLVGSKGKKELMAIGGSWSPSMDGADPASNPRTLVNTAVRTCRALTGIDLSKCTNWRRMLEIQYHRNSEVRKGRTLPDRVETTVIFLPDIHSCMPTSTEYTALRESYLNKCEAVIQAEQEEITPDPSASQQTTSGEESQQPAPDSESTTDVHTDQKTDVDVKEEPALEKEQDVKEEPVVQEAVTTPAKGKNTASDNAGSEPAEAGKVTPKLDIKSMKVPVLRRELESRGLSPRGLKAVLVTRLNEAMEAEAQKEEDDKLLMDEEDVEMQVLDEAGEKDEPVAKEDEKEKVEEKDPKPESEEQKEVEAKEEPAKEEATESEKKEEESPKKEKEEEDKKPKKELDVEKMRKDYTLPESHPMIPVHPNPEFRKGTFECSITPLSNLLGYRQEDNKESIFEVSLFAEAFTEMLQRDHAFNIYKALCNPLQVIEVEKDEEDEGDAGESEKKEGDQEDADGEPKAKKSKSDSEEETKKLEDESKSGKDGESDKQNGKESGDNKQQKDQDAKDKKEEKPASKPEEKMITLRKELLLSFVYFDQTQCGHITAGDMADIIHSIGIGLSRSQIKKLLSSYLEHDHLKYRKLTDVPASQIDAYKKLLENLPAPDVDTLACGNKSLMPVVITNGSKSHLEPMESDGIVSFNGAVVDIKALQDKLAISEEDQANKETTIEELSTQLESVTEELTETKDGKEKLQSEYNATQQKLSETVAELKSASDAKEKFEKTLKSIAKSIETSMPKEDEK